MAPRKKSAEAATKNAPPSKLTRLPKNARIQKRPLLHPPIPSPYASARQPKIVYISVKTPFISAVKRVRKLLEQIERRAIGSTQLLEGSGSEKQKLMHLSQQLASPKRKEEEVLLKATGRGIERALDLGLYFKDQGDVDVKVRTGTVSVVDDIVVPEPSHQEDSEQTALEKVDEKEEEDLPESRIRNTSFVEIAITLK